MYKKGQKAVFAVFLVPIITVILLGIIWSTVQTATVPTAVTNEAFTSVNDTFVALDYNDWVECSAVRNINGTTLGAAAGNYTVSLSGGSINVTTAGLGIDAGSGYTMYADYTYRADSYVDSSLGRTIVGYLPIMFALVVFVFIAGYIVLKKRSE